MDVSMIPKISTMMAMESLMSQMIVQTLPSGGSPPSFQITIQTDAEIAMRMTTMTEMVFLMELIYVHAVLGIGFLIQ